MTRLLLVLTSHDRIGDTDEPTGFHAGEAAHPWATFRDAGFEVDVISVRGGEPPADSRDDSDPAQRRFFADSGVATTPKAADVTADGYDGIFFAGGHGTMWDFPDDADLARLTAQVYEAGGVVGAVCHGPAALVNVKLSDGRHLVAGKRVAAFTNAEEEAAGKTAAMPFLLADTLTARGATHVPAANFTAQVVTDGRLVTGQNPASAAPAAAAVVALLKA